MDAPGALRIDREASAARIKADVEALSAPRFTSSTTAICRYAYSDAYGNTHDYFAAQLRGLGFEVTEDPSGPSLREIGQEASRFLHSARTSTRTEMEANTTVRSASSPRSRCAGLITTWACTYRCS